MLVLTRRKDEMLMLGDDIKITILDIDSDRVKIGIDAPRSTRILRAELKTSADEISNKIPKNKI